MKKRNGTVRYSAAKIAALRRKGATRTDWAKVDAMTEAQLRAAIAADPDDVHAATDWTQAVKGLPPRKQPIKLRLDADILAWFRATGKGYQTRINNVLRAFVVAKKGPAP
jgi:uncharacterized protein (DUF4415 family)